MVGFIILVKYLVVCYEVEINYPYISEIEISILIKENSTLGAKRIIKKAYKSDSDTEFLPCFMFLVMQKGFISKTQVLPSQKLFATPWIAARQASLSFTSPGVCSNSCPLNR